MFDLQKFADEFEEKNNYGDVLDNDNETSDVAEQNPIPPELEGIPDDIAREIMQKADSKVEEQTPEPVEEQDNGNVKIPYSRFKEVNDKKNETEKLLAEYRARYGDLNAAPSQPQKQQQTQQAILNADFAKQIDDAVIQRAMQICGLSKENVDLMDYYEDDDPRVGLWNHAKRWAEHDVYNGIIQNQLAQQQAFQRNELLRSQSMNNYNEFVAQQQAANNFNEVQQFAENEFFLAQPDIDKQIIYDSHSRIKSGMASPADVMIVRNFFEKATVAFKNKQAQPSQPQKRTPKPNNFPRTNKVSGSTGSGGGSITSAELDSMIKNKPWEAIPPQYQRLALGLT